MTADPRPLTPLIERLLDGATLSREEAAGALGHLTDAGVNGSQKAAFLTALRSHGEDKDELAGFAQAMLARSRGPLPTRPTRLLDTCGTGGDGSGSFNVSTATALLVASLGMAVAKHGNRAVSSKTGSADLVEALGIPFGETPAAAAAAIERAGFAFLFAPAFHPATAGVAAIRRELGMRTVFNVLGPLVNPARPTHQLVGAFSANTARAMAGALAQLDVERAFCVHGEPGWDEATPVGPFLLVDVRPGAVEEHTVDPRDYGFERCRPDDLAGGEASENVELLLGLFRGTKGPLRDAVLLNTALLLQLVGEEREPGGAVRRAAAALDDGRALDLVGRLGAAEVHGVKDPGSDFLAAMAAGSEERARAAHARASLADWRDRALATPAAPALELSPTGFDLIAEVKFTSPAEGALRPGSGAAAVQRAKDYAGSGAAAISILTEPSRFGGDLAFVSAAAAEVDVPVLRKDFLVDPVQVYEARAAGAGGVLLIARLADDDLLDRMIGAARECGMFVLLEAFDDDDLGRVLPRVAPTDSAPVLAGLNSRDLTTLEVDPHRLLELAPRFAEGAPAVAESGLLGVEDIERVAAAGYGLALVGTALMRADQPARMLTDLLEAGRRKRKDLRCASS